MPPLQVLYKHYPYFVSFVLQKFSNCLPNMRANMRLLLLQWETYIYMCVCIHIFIYLFMEGIRPVRVQPQSSRSSKYNNTISRYSRLAMSILWNCGTHEDVAWGDGEPSWARRWWTPGTRHPCLFHYIIIKFPTRMRNSQAL